MKPQPQNRPTPGLEALREEFVWFFRSARKPLVRSMRQFAEEEIVLPTGPFAGLRFRCDRQPFAGLWFDAVDSGRWNRFAATGPSQTGKSLVCFVIPVLHGLFELGETVGIGLPNADIAADKWEEDFKPVIDRTRYRDLIPRTGSGSRGGSHLEAIRFLNGATLRFFTGGGGDKSRASFTTRTLSVTETDGLDQSSETSREADKLKQLEARTRSFGARKRIFLECTVSTPQGRIWNEYTAGTASRIALRCPHCGKFSTPEREHLHGHQNAASETEAHNEGAFLCPVCAVLWSEDDRRAANLAAVLVHEGQTVDDAGQVVGEPKPTNTLGFRWTAVNNLFTTAGDIAAEEWKAKQAEDEDNAEKELCQFVWCIPYTPRQLDAARPEAATIARRCLALPRGQVPEDCEYLVASVDVGKWRCYWKLTAFRPNATPHVVEYGYLEVPSDKMPVEQAILLVLREFRDVVEAGWNYPGEKPRIPDQVWIDSNFQKDVVRGFCLESGTRYRPIIGRGEDQSRQARYVRPKKTGGEVLHIGDHFHFVRLASERVPVCEIDSDFWKTWLHERLVTPLDASLDFVPGAWTVFKAPAEDHKQLAKHLTAEVREESWEPGRGLRIKWRTLRRSNHWFDCGYIACACASFLGARLLQPPPPPTPVQVPPAPRFTMPDGRPFLITERES